MTETEINKPNLRELAKQGHPKAIALLLNRHLEPKGITVKSTLSKNCLKLMFEAEKRIPQAVLVEWLKVSLLRSIISDSITTVIIYQKRIGQDFPDWQEEIFLKSLHNFSTNKLESSLGDESSDSDDLKEQQNSISSKINEFGSLFNSIPIVTEQVKNTVVGTVHHATTQAGQSVREKALNIQGSVETLSNTVLKGKKLSFGNILNWKEAGKNTAPNASSKSESFVDLLNHNPLFKSLSKSLNVKKILEIIEQVDLAQVRTRVQEIKLQYPHESAKQISHRMMMTKVLNLGTSEIASKFVSERFISFIGVDAASSQILEFEMIYEIAYAYGFEIDDPSRKDEALTIFSLALGGHQALKLGLGLLEGVVPLAGTIISVSTNAAILYALGYAACRFYESNLDRDQTETTLETVHLESQKYLEMAIAQEEIIDQILADLLLARNRDQTWEKILPQLPKAYFSVHSLEIISKTVNSPPPLNDLLAQLNTDFAVVLLAKYQQINDLDQVKTSEEKQIIHAIQAKIHQLA